MPYLAHKDPWRGSAVGPTSLGRSGALVTPSDVSDLPRYARIRVFVPASLESAQIRILPLEQDDAAPLTLSLPGGQASVLEFLVRRVLETGTTPGLAIHAVY